jgi:protein-tyrosine phosphatase
MKILMVCLGNICRSPIAEGILQQKAKLAGLEWSVDSAGTNGYYNGEPPHHLSQKVSKAKGIDISSQKSRQLTKEDFSKFDKLYAMANDVLDYMKDIGEEKFDPSKSSLFLDELYPGEHRNVPDPWYGSDEGYVKVFDLIERTCDAIINNHNERIKK